MIIITIGFIIGMLIFCIGGAKLLLDNIGIILLVFFLLALLYVGLIKKPEMTLKVVAFIILLAVGSLIWVNVDRRIEEMNPTISIRRADTSYTFLDAQKESFTVPSGSIVAIFTDPRTEEPVCRWYYMGKVFSSSFHSNQSWRPDGFIQIGEIKLKEIERNWGALSAYVSETDITGTETEQTEFPTVEYTYEYSPEPQLGTETQQAEIELPTDDGTYAYPSEQKYWVIFTEGSRDNRIEMSTVDSSYNTDELYIIWNDSLYLCSTAGQSECNQYYLNENDGWVQIGNYHKLSDDATSIIASNLDIYDGNGNLIFRKTEYQNIDWSFVD